MSTIFQTRSRFLFGLLCLSSVLGTTAGCMMLPVAENTPRFPCAPPQLDADFPQHVFRPAGHENLSVALPSTWEPQLLTGNPLLGQARSLVIRSENEIWLVNMRYDLIRYRLDVNEITTYTVQTEDDAFVPTDLLVDPDGTLWGIGVVGVTKHVKRFDTLLSQYDPTQDRFVPVLDKSGLLIDMRPGMGQTFAADADGRLWVVANNALYSFDPTANTATLVLDEPEGYLLYDLTIAQDGTLWLAAYPAQEEMSVILHYDPVHGEIIKINSASGWDTIDYLDLYIDPNNRLWANDYGWLDLTTTPQPQWHPLTRSTYFITDRGMSFESLYEWSRPYQAYQSSDGILWYSSIAGLVRFDPALEDWCLIATITGPVVEDLHHNLWLVGNGQIYKYPLSSENTLSDETAK